MRVSETSKTHNTEFYGDEDLAFQNRKSIRKNDSQCNQIEAKNNTEKRPSTDDGGGDVREAQRLALPY